MKNIKAVISAVIFLTLAFFIFFSNSVYTFNIPEVTAVMPSNGRLNKKETATGIVEWLNVSEIYAELSGKVEEIYVSEGDVVAEGQPLIRFSFSEDDVSNKLRELEINRSKQQIDIENLNIRLNRIHRYIAELEAEIYEKDEISYYELEQLEVRLGSKKDEYEATKTLYDAGAVSKQALESVEAELQSLYAQYANLSGTLAEQEDKAGKSLVDKESARQKQLLDYQHDITTINQDLKTKSLDLRNLDMQEENYKKTLADYEKNMTIYSSEACTVTAINIKKGQQVNANALMMSFGVGSDYKIVCDVNRDNNFITAGDEAKLYNSSYTQYFYANVTKITPQTNAKQITVTISSDELTAGETFELTFEKESAQRSTLIPNGAVNQDSDGYYVYRIKRRNGILGKEYYAEKVRIDIGDSDNENTLLIGGMTFFEPIVLLSDKPFSENDTIKLKNEGDFFAGD